jgi:hypothetical protein
MSHRHIHALQQPTDKAPKVHFWPIAVLVVVLGLPIILFIYGRIINSSYDTADLTTSGAVSDRRIVMDEIGNSTRGGWVHYHLEARVTYQAEGHAFDRWLRVPRFDSSRAALEAVRARRPENCQVYWSLGHPENARCRME